MSDTTGSRIQATEVTLPEDKKRGERVFCCHDTVHGYRANIRLYSPSNGKGEQDRLRAIAIAAGHFVAKDRALGNALV